MYGAEVSLNMRSFARVGVLTSLLVSVVLIVPIHVSKVSAESYTIELGETFYYDRCWTNVGNSARLERKVPGKTTWNQVARAKPVRSSECDSGSKLVSYKWKPKSVGKHRLRESLSYVSGSKRTYAKSFTLTIVEPSSDSYPPATIATLPPATIATLPPSLGTGGGVSSGSVSLTSSWSDLFQRYSISGSAGGSSVSLTSSWSDLFQRYSISGSGPAVISAIIAAISIQIR